jgi:hypothetical protein
MVRHLQRRPTLLDSQLLICRLSSLCLFHRVAYLQMRRFLRFQYVACCYDEQQSCLEHDEHHPKNKPINRFREVPSAVRQNSHLQHN